MGSWVGRKSWDQVGGIEAREERHCGDTADE